MLKSHLEEQPFTPKSQCISQDSSIVKKEPNAKCKKLALILALVKAKIGIVYHHLHSSRGLKKISQHKVSDLLV